MKANPRALVATAAIALVAGLALGLLNAYVARRGGTPMPMAQIAMMAAAISAVGYGIVARLSGNAASERAGAEDDRRAKAFAVAPDRATIYVFRDAFYARLVGFDLALDGVEVGQTRGKTFFRLDVAPGSHRLEAVNPQDGARADVTMTLAPGEIVFVEQPVRLAAKGAVHRLVPVARAEAEGRIRRCRMLLAAATVRSQPV